MAIRTRISARSQLPPTHLSTPTRPLRRGARTAGAEAASSLHPPPSPPLPHPPRRRAPHSPNPPPRGCGRSPTPARGRAEPRPRAPWAPRRRTGGGCGGGRPRGRSRQRAPGAVTPGRREAARRPRGRGGAASPGVARRRASPVPSRHTHIYTHTYIHAYTHTRGTAPGGGSRLGPRPAAHPGRAGARVRPPRAPHLPGPRRGVGGRAPARRYCGGPGGPGVFGGGSVIRQALGSQM